MVESAVSPDVEFDGFAEMVELGLWTARETDSDVRHSRRSGIWYILGFPNSDGRKEGGEVYMRP